jgi:hypothetical protein
MKIVIGIASVVIIIALVFLLFAQYLPQSEARAERNFKGAQIDSSRNNMLTEKPYFSISLESDLCMGYFLLNGQLLYAAEMARVKFDLPVNHWIRKGENELVMMLAPVDEQGNFGKFPRNMKCTMTLRVRQSGSNSEKTLTIAALKFAAKDPTGIESNTPERRLDSKNGFVPANKGDVLISKAKKEPFQEVGAAVGAIVTRSITLPEIGLPEWKFFKSDNITNLSGVDIAGRLDKETSDRLKKELLPIYRQIWSALKARKLEEVLPLFEERNNEMDAAFFRKPGETGNMLAKELKDNASDPKKKLWPITDDNVIIQLYDNNKLVRLSQNNDKPLLSFDHVTVKGSSSYDVIFRKSGNKWIITR